jgi:hypothetical protein
VPAKIVREQPVMTAKLRRDLKVPHCQIAEKAVQHDDVGTVSDGDVVERNARRDSRFRHCL